MKSLDNQDWQNLYDRKFIQIDGVIPFEQMVKNPQYRLKWAMRMVEGLKGKSLDIGCNTGLLVHMQIATGFEGYGVDVSPLAIESCKKNVPAGKFEVCFADEKLPYPDNFFDVVTCLEVLEHVKDEKALLREVFRVLKPKGKFLCSTPVGTAYQCPEHLRFFDYYQLCDLFDAYAKEFTICKILKNEQNTERLLFGIEVLKDGRD